MMPINSLPCEAKPALTTSGFEITYYSLFFAPEVGTCIFNQPNFTYLQQLFSK
jgi:hypothetical protein